MRQVSDILKDILDATAAVAGVDGPRESFWELLGVFRAAWPTLLHDIREALVKGDLGPVEDAAHLLKIAAQNVAVRRVYLAALLLEKTASYGELEGAQQACDWLEEEIDHLQLALALLGNGMAWSRC